MKLFWQFVSSFLHPYLHSPVTMSSTTSYSSSGETSPEDIPRGGGTIRVYLPNKQRTVVSCLYDSGIVKKQNSSPYISSNTDMIYIVPFKSNLPFQMHIYILVAEITFTGTTMMRSCHRCRLYLRFMALAFLLCVLMFITAAGHGNKDISSDWY